MNEVNDLRHDVTDRMLSELKEVAYSQDDFGIKKYNTPLNHHLNYDWLRMLHEELADGLKYLQNEMDRKELVVAQLEYAITMKDWNYVQIALNALSKTGTGK